MKLVVEGHIVRCRRRRWAWRAFPPGCLCACWRRPTISRSRMNFTPIILDRIPMMDVQSPLGSQALHHLDRHALRPRGEAAGVGRRAAGPAYTPFFRRSYEANELAHRLAPDRDALASLSRPAARPAPRVGDRCRDTGRDLTDRATGTGPGTTRPCRDEKRLWTGRLRVCWYNVYKARCGRLPFDRAPCGAHPDRITHPRGRAPATSASRVFHHGA